MKQIDVQIMGHGYVLSCPEDAEQRLRDAVHKVDEAMCRIRDHGKIKARDRIAVLAAVNLSFDQTNAASPLTPPRASSTPTPTTASSPDSTMRSAMTAGCFNSFLKLALGDIPHLPDPTPPLQ